MGLAVFGGLVQASVQLNIEPGQEVLVSGERQTTYIRIGLEGLPIEDQAQRAPLNLALVLDRSGSMRGEKLSHAKQAAKLALDHLRPQDILSLVTYDHTVSIPLAAAPFSDRARVERAIDGIRAGGNTALFAGVSKGAGELREYLEENRVNRIVLLSDGLANTGPSSPAELQRLGQKLGGETISVTTIGLGLGYNEDLMVRLADASDGNHIFAERPEELAEVFRAELGELSAAVAQGVTITIECPPEVRPLRILGRNGEIRDHKVTARLNQLYAEQEKYLVLEVETSDALNSGEQTLARVAVEFDDLRQRRPASASAEVRVRIGESRAEAEASINRKVMVSASEQIAAELDDEALELKDRGDTKGAQEVFRRKADYLGRQATTYDSDKLRVQSDFSRGLEEAVTAPTQEWKKARKEAREEQYIIRNQQSYK
jgi:Ca-activated chloride channel family protein